MKLPNRRECEHFEFVFRGRRYEVGMSRFANGAPAEIFLGTAKSGEEMQAIARDAAITLSLMLQHGAPLAPLRDAVTRTAAGDADSPIGALLDRLHELGEI